MSLINNILEEWAYRVDNGMPNPSNLNHINELSQILTEMGLYEIKDELIRNLTEADTQFTNPILNKKIKYKDSNGDDAEGVIGNLLRLQKDHPGRKAAEAQLPPDGSEERKKINKDLGSGDKSKTAEPKAKDGKEEPTSGDKPKEEPKTNPMFDPKADPAMAARLDAEKQTLDKLAKGDETDEPTKLEPVSSDPNSKAKQFKGKLSGKDIQTIPMEGGGQIYGTVHRNKKMVDDIINDVKANIPEEKWKDIVFVGEGGSTGKNGEIVFHDEMKYAAPKFKELGAGIDTFDGDELDVHNDQSKLYKRQMEKTGLNQSQVNAGNWASMIGQGEGTDTMSPNDYLDDEGKKFIQDEAVNAGFPPIENWDEPTDRDIDTLYRLSFPEDYGDKETKINDIQVAFNEIRDESIIEKTKQLQSQGKIPITIAGESHVELVDKMMQKSSKPDSDFQPVEPNDVTKEMPKADSAAFSGQSDIDKLTKQERKEISMKIDELNKMTQDAIEKGEKAPNYNLCQVTVPGTNLYCDNNLGIPREDMPQFKGKPQPGTPAADMPVDKNGEVDTEPMFKKMLADRNIKVLDTEIPSDSLKATQSELVGSKVAGMTKALEKDPNHPSITAPIYVSRDGYVVDGHHRWAAVTSAAIKAGKPADMKVRVIDMDAKDIIPMANKFAEEQGVAAKKADANQEGPKSDIANVPKVEDEKGTTAKTSSGKTLYSIGSGYYSDRPNGEPKYIRADEVARRAFFEDDEKAFLLIFEATIKADVEGGEEGTFIEVNPKDREEAQNDIDATEAEEYEKMKPADKAKLIASRIESNDASFAEAENKEEHTLSLLQNRNDGINKNHMLPPGNTGSSFAENNGAYYIQQIFNKGGKLSKEDVDKIISEMESTKLGKSMPEADRKRWALIALRTAMTEANILLNEKRYKAKNPQPEGYPQGAIMDKQNKASVERILRYKLEEAKSNGDTKSAKHYETQLNFLKDLAETDTGILYVTNDGTIGFKHTSNKSSYDDPHNNTSPAEVMNYLKKHLGDSLDSEVGKVFEESLTKLENASSGIQGDVKKFNESQSTKTKEQIEKENKTFAKALSSFPILGGGKKDYLRGDQGIVSKKWFKAYAKEKGLTEPYEDSDIMNAVFENAASDKPDSSAQKIILKLSEVVEKANDGNIGQLADKYNLTIDEMASMMGTAGKFFTGTAKSRRDVMAEVHNDIVTTIQKADAKDSNAYPTNPNGDNGPHQKAYVEGFLHRMHFDAYIIGTRDGVSSQNIGGDNVEPEHYRACLGELSGYGGDTTTEEGRKGLVDYLSKRVRISPDNDSISFETREGKVIKLGVDKYRTKGDSKGVLGSLGKDLKTCLKSKAKK
jgi:hypothetical protein